MYATASRTARPQDTWLQDINDRLETAPPQAILRWAVETYPGTLTMATAFGAEGCCLIAMLAQIREETGQTPDIFNLNVARTN
jgi:3'-phosphoadenosine 5'-phosphosulfate sulfotransferase (PAPS reductase)/FAD synthetase